MDSTRGTHELDADGQPYPLPKRQKTSQHHQNDVHRYAPESPPTLRYDQYTVAWICALHIELAAAEAMLDRPHEALPTHIDDTNTYTLGSIKQHNIVIACLPVAQYGTNNAANVVTNLKRTFPSIRASLMVGIGGGVPSREDDLHLGDIVVGTRVMQCDLGKIVEGGQIERTAIPRLPPQLLGTVVSALRAKHEREPSQVQNILQEKMNRFPAYGLPNSEDCIFQSTYNHEKHDSPNCDGCDRSKLVSRRRRMCNFPVIHYGAIASGNQVMRDGKTRDEVARQLDIICFEMEAAGIVDTLSCLVIRGICDYSDSHKNKEWQRYAAATAAAYARELLHILPGTDGGQTGPALDSVRPESTEAVIPNRRQRFLESLKFDQIDTRKTSIKKEHAKTCLWVLKHPEYQAWLDPRKRNQHHGLLWIRGKPGAGKSTIMKFLYLKNKGKASVIASFFFNARGSTLEKSISGMYRSLLLQLLESFPDLQAVLDDDIIIPRNQQECPSLQILKDTFASALSALGQRSFTCFIDALDECDEQQVMDMVQYFEDLAESALSKHVQLRICFSSRHYPYIDIRFGVRFTLEDQPGHSADLSQYVQSKLRIRPVSLVEEFTPKILEKSSGVFLWVVLVVEILNQENRRGRPSLRKRLDEVPSGLSELFKDILRRDTDNMEDLMLCILWVLYAKRPLKPEEYYHALWSGLFPKGLLDTQVPDVGVSDADATFERYIISSSKGLAEITKSKQPTVQFIHESVRDFLVKDRGLYELWPHLGFNWEAPSHEILKQCCDSYMKHRSVLVAANKSPSEVVEISKEYPFLEYASQHILYHADSAADTVPQDNFLSLFNIAEWICIVNRFEKFQSRQYNLGVCLYYILADRGLPELIRTRLKIDPRPDVFGGRYEYPLFAALAGGHKDAVAALLNSPSSTSDGVEITNGLNRRTDFKEYKGRTPLSWAAQTGRLGLAKLLLEKGANVNEVDKGAQTALHRALKNKRDDTAKLLIEKRADINTFPGESPLILALLNNCKDTARLLIEKGADIKTFSGESPLIIALENKYKDIARLLIEKGANIKTFYGESPLIIALENKYKDIARLLIEKGVDIETFYGKSPLIIALENKYEDIARLLIEKGADIKTFYGESPLIIALKNKYEDIARLLIEKGADIKTFSGESLLIIALKNKYEDIARLLIEKGAYVRIEFLLIIALENQFEDIARLLLEKANIQINAHQKSPLTTALRNKYENIAKLLIEKGTYIHMYPSWIHSLTLALKNKYEDIIKVLVEKGPNIYTGNYTEGTPLTSALSSKCQELARFFIEEGACIDTKLHNGDTPLIIALKNGGVDMAKLLIKKGANISVQNRNGETPLTCAASLGYQELAIILIQNEDDASSLSPALRSRHEAIARFLGVKKAG